MTHRIEDLNRRTLNLSENVIREILPEHFTEDYPDLITFLEKYYDFLDSSGEHSFKREIDNIIAARDISQTDDDYLDELVKEIGDGLQSASFFTNPRLMTKLLSNFYRTKGTLVGAEGFFRGFFNEEVVIEYPKSQILTINDADNNYLSHTIGWESQKFIQNNKRYQIFSILVKSGLSVNEWSALYKRLVHPAGFYLEGEVSLENTGFFFDSAFTGVDSDEIRGTVTVGPSYVSFASTEPVAPFIQLTALYDSNGVNVRSNLNQTIDIYQNLNVTELDDFYENIAEIASPNSFTFDNLKQSDPISLYYDPSVTSDAPINVDFTVTQTGAGNKWAVMQLDSNVGFTVDSANVFQLQTAPYIGREAVNRYLRTTYSSGFDRYTITLIYYDSGSYINPIESTVMSSDNGDSSAPWAYNLTDGIQNIQSGQLYHFSEFDSDWPGQVIRVNQRVYDSASNDYVSWWSYDILTLDSDGADMSGPGTSLTTETMDETIFTRYTSDSAI